MSYQNMPTPPSSPALGYGEGFGVNEGIAAKKAGIAHLTDIVPLNPDWETELKGNLSPQAGGTNTRGM